MRGPHQRDEGRAHQGERRELDREPLYGPGREAFQRAGRRLCYEFSWPEVFMKWCKRACFMFGNALKGEDQLTNMLLPRLVSMNSLNFDFGECCFSDKMMTVKDKKDGLSREGSGRVGIMRATDGLPNCYTLECNYASGKRIN